MAINFFTEAQHLSPQPEEAGQEFGHAIHLFDDLLVDRSCSPIIENHLEKTANHFDGFNPIHDRTDGHSFGNPTGYLYCFYQTSFLDTFLLMLDIQMERVAENEHQDSFDEGGFVRILYNEEFNTPQCW